MFRLMSATSFALTMLAGSASIAGPDYQPVQRMLDLSGLAWLGGDRFLLVHDAKDPDELDRVRVSFLKTPVSLDGMMWAPLDVAFPDAPSSDLESASRIPGTDQVVLAESNDDAGQFRRLFLAEYDEDAVKITSAFDWTNITDAYNVEATAVAPSGDGYLFIWAERNSGKQSTDIQWSKMSLDPFSISPPIGSATFTLPSSMTDGNGDPLYTRSIVGMDVDSLGNIYTVAAFDPEGTVKNPDNGPFRSAVFKVGHVEGGAVKLLRNIETLATADGFKIESVSVVERDGESWMFIGTDDENYGGTLRRLPQ